MKLNSQNLREYIPLLAFLLIGSISIGFLNFSMALQPWANSDSSLYINLAKNIAEGNGFVTNYPSGRLAFVGLHPPFYSIVLSLFLKFHLPWVDGIRYLNIAVFTLFILVCGLWTFKLTKNLLAGIFVSTALLVNPDLFMASTGTMSEPLYLLLSLISMFLLVEALLHPEKRIGWLIFSAIFAGLASFTRFIGASSILAGCVILLVCSTARFWKRLWLSFLYGVIGSIPLFSWLVIKEIYYSTDSSRNFILPVDFLHSCSKVFYGVVDTTINWVPLTSLISDIRPRRWIFLGIAVVFLGIFLGVNYKKLRDSSIAREPRSLLGMVSLFSIIPYLIVFLLSYVFSTVPPDIYGRTLLTLFPYLIISLSAFLVIAFYGFHNFRSYITAFFWVLLVISFIPANFMKTAIWAQERHNTRDGFLQEKYVNSELMEAIRNLPDKKLLISSQASLILLHTGKYPYEFSEFSCDSIKARKDIPFGAGNTPNDQRYRDGLFLAMFTEDIDHFFVTCLPDNWVAHRQIFLNQSIPIVTTSDGVLYKYNPDAGSK